jgi:hypothetical protein
VSLGCHQRCICGSAACSSVPPAGRNGGEDPQDLGPVSRLSEFIAQLKGFAGFGHRVRPPVVVKILGGCHAQEPRQDAESPLGTQRTYSPDAKLMPFRGPS